MFRFNRPIVVLLLGGFCLVSLGLIKWTSTFASPLKSGVPVNVHGINYTAEPFDYVLTDPTNPSSGSIGEHISPFSGGGITCCYVLPKLWGSGKKIKVLSKHWLPNDAKGNPIEISKEYIVEIPKYQDGKAADLWILRNVEGGIEVVVSNVEPDHPLWPGKTKGWPRPSISYLREMWETDKKRAERNVKIFEDALSEMERSTEVHTRRVWQHDLDYKADEVAGFAGPDDPAYQSYLLKRYERQLRIAKNRLKQVNEGRP